MQGDCTIHEDRRERVEGRALGWLFAGTEEFPQSYRGPGLFYDLSVHISLTKLTQDAGVTETQVVSKAGPKCTCHDLL